MKLMKAMKQLKFWSSKKKRNKFHHQYHRLTHDDQYVLPTYNSPPPPLRPPPPRSAQALDFCQCHFCESAEPSAPPLPPWLDSQQWSDSSHYNWVDPFASVSQSQPGSSEDCCISISEDMDMIMKPSNSHLYENPEMQQDISSEHVSPAAVRTQQAAGVSQSQAGSSEDCCISISEYTIEKRSNSQLCEKTENPEMQPDANSENVLPVAVRTHNSTSVNLFGCVVDVGALLFRCLFPCFHISEGRAFNCCSSTSSQVRPDQTVGKMLI